MKKLLFILLIISFVSVTINAQDIIFRKNGDEIKAKVIEVGNSEIKYKRFENQSGPTYVIKTSEVFMIKYENGEKDVFNEQPGSQKEKTADARQRSENTKTTSNRQDNQNQIARKTTDNNLTTEAPEQSTKTPSVIKPRKGYVGLSLGFNVLLKDYNNADFGSHVCIGAGYFFKPKFGIAASYFTTSFPMSNKSNSSLGLAGFMVGPIFSTGLLPNTNKIEIDIKPMIGYGKERDVVNDNVYFTDEGTFLFGLDATVFWNLSHHFALSFNANYYFGKVKDDLSSTGLSVGANYRF